MLVSLLFYLLFGFVSSTENISEDVKEAFFEMIDFFENENVKAFMSELTQKDVQNSLCAIWILDLIKDKFYNTDDEKMPPIAKRIFENGVEDLFKNVDSLLNQKVIKKDEIDDFYASLLQFIIPSNGVVPSLKKVFDIVIIDFTANFVRNYEEVKKMISELKPENELLKISHGNRQIVLSKNNVKKFKLMSDICSSEYIIALGNFLSKENDYSKNCENFEFLKEPAVIAQLINRKFDIIFKNEASKIMQFLNSEEALLIVFFINNLFELIQKNGSSIAELVKMSIVNEAFQGSQ